MHLAEIKTNGKIVDKDNNDSGNNEEILSAEINDNFQEIENSNEKISIFFVKNK